MYQDIGLRNHQAIQRNGYKLVEKWKEKSETLALASKYKDLLEQQELLFKAANLVVNQ